MSQRPSATEGQHTPASLADVLERDYFPMPDGAKLYLNEYEWRMVVTALRSETPAIPEGWKLVPMEATQEMLDAAKDAMAYGGAGGNAMMQLIHAASLAAAPSPDGNEESR